MRQAWVVLLLSFTALSGCAESPDEPIEQAEQEACDGGFCGQEAVESQDGRDLRTDLRADDTVQAPEWQVGDVFEQHMFFGKDDREGLHIRTMVTEVRADGYILATSDPQAARFEAVYDYPVLGFIGKGLETRAFQADWSWMYRFPLHDGDTWTADLQEQVNWNSHNVSDHQLTLTASYDPAIDTPHGDYPGLWIEGVTSEGDLLARYNYVPAIGWFSHFWLYDIETSDPDDIMFHAMSMGAWTGYNGTYYTGQAETVIDDWYGFFPAGGSPDAWVQGEPGPRDFDVPEGERIMGIAIPIAAGGRTDIRIEEPDGGQAVYTHQKYGLEGPDFTVYFVDQEAEPGTWTAEYIGAAVFHGAYLWLNVVSIEAHTLA